jgi:hypothetical protein
VKARSTTPRGVDERFSANLPYHATHTRRLYLAAADGGRPLEQVFRGRAEGLPIASAHLGHSLQKQQLSAVLVIVSFLSDFRDCTIFGNSIKMTPTTMRAARYYGKEDVRIENTPRPRLAPGQILIKPSHVGICGTDLHEYIAGPT